MSNEQSESEQAAPQSIEPVAQPTPTKNPSEEASLTGVSPVEIPDLGVQYAERSAETETLRTTHPETERIYRSEPPEEPESPDRPG
jgi:hypothetical protein